MTPIPTATTISSQWCRTTQPQSARGVRKAPFLSHWYVKATLCMANGALANWHVRRYATCRRTILLKLLLQIGSQRCNSGLETFQPIDSILDRLHLVV